jgi:hypothetical protein
VSLLYGTTTTRSFEGALVEHGLLARTRTKYVPRGTVTAVKSVDGLPVGMFARFDRPVAEPYSIT